MSSLLACALAYASSGWRVFPCEPRDKKPVLVGRSRMNWQRHATTDPDKIGQWWAKWPDANIGLVTGWPDGPGVVLDVDDRSLLAEVPERLTCGRAATTGKDGYHLYWALPAGVSIGNSTGNLPRGRADVRGCGSGYVLASPSIHPNGNSYRWCTEGEPTVMPSWLLEVIQGTREWGDWGRGYAFDATKVDTTPHEPVSVIERARRWLDQRAPAISGSGGHTWTFETAQFLTRGFDMDPSTAADLMLSGWNASCQPPWKARDIHRKCEQARAKGSMVIGSQLVDAVASRHTSSGAVISPTAAATAPTPPQAWAAPEPLQEQTQLPRFPLDVLPEWAEEWADAVSEATQTPPELAGMLALVSASAALAKKAVVRIKSDWAEPLNLWVIVGMDPSSRKSPVFAAATAPLREHEQRRSGALSHDIAMALHKVDVETGRLKKLKARMAKYNDNAERLELLDQLERQQRELEDAEAAVPVAERMLAQDATTESLIALMQQNGGKIAVLSDEGGILGIAAGRYNSGRVNLDALLQGYGGGDITVDRRGREPEFVKNSALTLGLTVQVEVLREAFSNPAIRGRGFMARPLYVVPKSNIGHRRSALETREVPEVLTQVYRAGLLALCGMTSPGPEPFELRPTPEAKRLLLSWDKRLEPDLGRGGRLQHISWWAAKLTGAVARVAGILHISDHGLEDQIDEATMWRAVKLGNFLLEHASAAFDLMRDDSATIEAKAAELITWLQGQPSPISRRTIQQARKRHFSGASELDAVLDLLAETGALRLVSPRPQLWAVNPQASPNGDNGDAWGQNGDARKSTALAAQVANGDVGTGSGK